jgi:Fe-S cluster assembly iron-binding protein IscA
MDATASRSMRTVWRSLAAGGDGSFHPHAKLDPTHDRRSDSDVTATSAKEVERPSLGRTVSADDLVHGSPEPVDRLEPASSDRDRVATATRSVFARLRLKACATTSRHREGVAVFELTNRAAAALAERRALNGLAESIAIRISTSDSGNGSSSVYSLRFASQPWTDDLVLESSGTKVFLAAGLAEPPGGSVLDVVDTPQGPHLVLKHQPLTDR